MRIYNFDHLFESSPCPCCGSSHCSQSQLRAAAGVTAEDFATARVAAGHVPPLPEGASLEEYRESQVAASWGGREVGIPRAVVARVGGVTANRLAQWEARQRRAGWPRAGAELPGWYVRCHEAALCWAEAEG